MVRVRQLCLPNNIAFRTNYDYDLGHSQLPGKSCCDNACAVSRSVSITSDTIPPKSKKESWGEHRYASLLGSRPHSPTSKSKSFSSHMVLRRRKACRLISLDFESACFVEALVSPCASWTTAHTHVISSHVTSPHPTPHHSHLTSPHPTSYHLTSSYFTSPDCLRIPLGAVMSRR